MCFAYLRSPDQIISATAIFTFYASSHPAESGTPLRMLPVASSAISCRALFILSLHIQI